jgi:protein transport protein SEC23
MARNHFPPHYAENITETNLPAELIPQFTTVEYELPTPPAGPPVFLFVVDTCLDEEELSHLRDALQQTLNLLPDDSLVGLITFGNLVHVHELGFTECSKSFVFRGDRDYTTAKVHDMLGVTSVRGGPVAQIPHGGNSLPKLGTVVGRFLLPVSDCSFALEQVLEDLQRDPWPNQTDERPQRFTGNASFH